jgi:hypothetical protein
MNRLNTQTTVSQNPKLLEEITWQESAIYGMVFMLKTDEVNGIPCICFPTFNVISFSFFKNFNPFTTIFGDVLQ